MSPFPWSHIVQLLLLSTSPLFLHSFSFSLLLLFSRLHLSCFLYLSSLLFFLSLHLLHHSLTLPFFPFLLSLPLLILFPYPFPSFISFSSFPPISLPRLILGPSLLPFSFLTLLTLLTSFPPSLHSSLSPPFVSFPSSFLPRLPLFPFAFAPLILLRFLPFLPSFSLSFSEVPPYLLSCLTFLFILPSFPLSSRPSPKSFHTSSPPFPPFPFFSSLPSSPFCPSLSPSFSKIPLSLPSCLSSPSSFLSSFPPPLSFFQIPLSPRPSSKSLSSPSLSPPLLFPPPPPPHFLPFSLSILLPNPSLSPFPALLTFPLHFFFILPPFPPSLSLRPSSQIPLSLPPLSQPFHNRKPRLQSPKPHQYITDTSLPFANTLCFLLDSSALEGQRLFNQTME
ncbi:hypothetical protein C7M84_017740 [Penaeus vannamei]|uniref:Uncharacterized protein n=1 Tax=Penaeus vannamei TaxID=6689 RepID=A0A3R7QDT4_PENVA|nr:hypothetical protein C7M84_017740 [Penaeus vannamei]